MNISKIKENANDLFHSQLFWIQVFAVGRLLVLQTSFGDDKTAQRVYVVGGNIDAEVSGYLDANVNGSVVVDNTVSVEIENTVRTWNW